MKKIKLLLAGVLFLTIFIALSYPKTEEIAPLDLNFDQLEYSRHLV